MGTQILSDITVFMKYSRYNRHKKRRETWGEIVNRNKVMHLKKYPDLKDEIENAYKFVYTKKVLPSMRALQFSGKAIDINPARGYNCSAIPINTPAAFHELMFLLLSGCGVGISVQKHHIEQLPEIVKPRRSRRFLVSDSIEGWADAVKALIKAYMGVRTSAPNFDFSDIRQKGTPLKTSGGTAPGPEPLITCLHHIKMLFERKESGEKLTPLEAYDICCFMADAVLAGGIRRAAMIALFSFGDEEMMTSKFGHWYETAPQRARANNSVVLLRHKITKKAFDQLWEKIEKSGCGEPGFFFTNDKEWLVNPCAEISLRACQFCNLTTINAGTVKDQNDLNMRARVASFLGTLQAGYTNFHYLRDVWKTTTEKEALIGVSMTGIASGNVLGLDLKQAAKIVVEENQRVADLIGINSAARCTAIKPEGTSSLVVGTSSGIHAWHSSYYIRRLRVGKEEPIYAYLKENLPGLMEDDFFKEHEQAVMSIPIKAPDNAITRTETALQLLARIRKFHVNWINPGHVEGYNMNNVSATIPIKPHEWGRVREWMWANRNKYTALSVLPYNDHTYVQAPFEEIDETVYMELLKLMKKVDLTEVKENKDNTSLRNSAACGGGQCELR